MSDLQLKIRPDDTDCTHELDGPTTPIENRMLVGTCSICGSQVAEFIDNDGTPTGMSLIVEPGYLESAPARCEPRPTLADVINQTYLVALQPPNQAVQQVIAATVEFHGEHLTFLAADGKLAALFLQDMVRSWNVLPCR